MWKVFEFTLKEYEQATFYRIDNIVLLCCDPENPYPMSKLLWNKKDNSFSKIHNIIFDKIICPLTLVVNEDLDDFFKWQIKSMYDSYYKEYHSMNLFLITKPRSDYNNRYIEVGTFLWEGIGRFPNELYQKYLDQIHTLKAFL